MQADNAFQLQCGRPLTLPELRYIHESRTFGQLIQGGPIGLTGLSRQLADEFSEIPCKKKGAQGRPFLFLDGKLLHPILAILIEQILDLFGWAAAP